MAAFGVAGSAESTSLAVGVEHEYALKSSVKVRKTQEGGVELCSQKLLRSLR